MALMALISPEVFRFYPEDIQNSVEIGSPEEILQQLLEYPEVKSSAVRILLFHGSLQNARQLAADHPSLNIIIAGHEQQIADGEMSGDTILVSPGAEGNDLGHLRITVTGGKILYNNEFIQFDYMKDPDDPFIRKRIEKYYVIMTERLNTN